MKVIYTKVSNERKKEYALCTKILRDADGVCSMKQALYDEGVEHIKNMLDSKRVLGGKYANSPISLSEIRYNDGAVIIEFAEGELFEKELDYFLHNNDLAGFKSAVDSFFGAYLVDAKECIDAKDSFFPNELIGGFNSFVKELDIDAIFGNIKYKEGEWKLFDYEWTILKYVPTRFFIYRCLFYYTNNANRFSFQKTMYDLYGFDSDEIEACERMEYWFQKYIKGDCDESSVSVPVGDKSYNDMHIDDYYMHTIKRLENECEEKNKEVARLHEQVHLLEIESSKSLKRRIFERFRITRLVLKIWDLGFKTTINKIGTRLRHEKYNRFVKEPIVIVKPIIKTGKNIYSLEDIDELTSFNKKIAVHLHLFYVDLFEEFIWYLNNMPFEYDLFISMISDEDIKYVKSRCKSLNKCNKYVVRVMENRGRDIAPLYVGFRDELVKYDYFLHMHSKKSLYTGTEKKGWRQMSLDSDKEDFLYL